MKNSYALRITATVLFLTILVGLAPHPATAQGSGISVTIPKVDPEPNTTTTLSITADLGQNQIRTYSNLEFTFDPSVLEVVEVRDGEDLSFGSQNLTVKEPSSGTVRISNLYQSAVSGSGQILQIDVRLTEEASTSFRLTPSDLDATFPTSVFETETGDILEIETINQGQVGNEPPSVGVTVPDQTLETPAPPLEVRGLDAALFSDPDGNELTFAASSSNPSVLAVTGESEEGVTLQPQAPGTADVTVTALDIFDASASTTVSITVEARSPEADEPIAHTATVLAPAADGVPIDTDAAGVVLRGASISGSGIATVDRFDTAPDGTDGIGEGSVSSYRAVLSTGSGLTLGAQSEVRFPVADFAGIATPDDVVVYRRPTPGSGTFTALPTRVDDGSTTGDPTDDAVVGEMESQISGGELVLASTDDALPVELADFSVATNGSTAQLEWTTASETNNAGFEIQHRPPQASQYRESGFVEPQRADPCRGARRARAHPVVCPAKPGSAVGTPHLHGAEERCGDGRPLQRARPESPDAVRSKRGSGPDLRSAAVRAVGAERHVFRSARGAQCHEDPAGRNRPLTLSTLPPLPLVRTLRNQDRSEK